MNQQPVPAPPFSPPPSSPPEAKPITLRWGLSIIGLIISAGFLFERVWLASVAPDRHPSASVTQASTPTVDASPLSPPAETPVTPVIVDRQEERSDLLEPEVEAVPEEALAARRPQVDEQDIRQRAEHALQSVRLSRLRSAADAAQQELETLQAQLETWNEATNPLMTNDRGRQIAADPDQLERVAEMLVSTQETQERAARLESELDLLLDPLHATTQSGADAGLPEEFTAELNNLRTAIRSARVEQQDRRAALDALVSRADDDPPGSEAPTLQEALDQRRISAASEREALLAEARRMARAEVDAQLAKAEAEREAAEGRVKLLEVQAQKQQAQEAERVLTDALKEAARLREEARQKAELVRRFEREWPRMRAYLVPFTSEGFTQPGGHGFERTTERGPVSFGKLQGRGVLKKQIPLLQALYYITTGNGMNDRDHGAFPEYSGGAADWARKHETIQTIQDFLNEYGPVMVEKGLLAL